MALVASEEHEYFKAVGKRAIADLWKYHNHPENFQSSKFSEGEIKVYTMKSDNPDCPEDIAKASISLEGTTLNHALALVLPWMPYRTQWDDLLARVKVLDEISPTMKIVHHVTKKKTPLSARDSVDVVSIDARKSTSTVILAARSVEKADVPELKDHVRTFQHLGGFVIQDCGEGKIDFELYFHGDLKVSGGIPFVKSIIETIKPKFMVDMAKNLRKAIRGVPVLPSDMQDTLICTTDLTA